MGDSALAATRRTDRSGDFALIGAEGDVVKSSGFLVLVIRKRYILELHIMTLNSLWTLRLRKLWFRQYSIHRVNPADNLHIARAFVSIQGNLYSKSDDNTERGGEAETPIHRKEDDNHGDWCDNSADHIRQLMGDKALYFFDVFVGDFS